MTFLFFLCTKLNKPEASFQKQMAEVQKQMAEVQKQMAEVQKQLKDSYYSDYLGCYCDGACPKGCEDFKKITNLYEITNYCLIITNYKELKVDVSKLKGYLMFAGTQTKPKLTLDNINILMAVTDMQLNNDFAYAARSLSTGLSYLIQDFDFDIDSLVMGMNMGSSESYDMAMYFGDAPSIVVDTDAIEFYLIIQGASTSGNALSLQSDSSKVLKLDFDIQLNFEKEATLEVTAYDSSGQEIELEDYTTEPPLQYTGTISNADSLGSSFKQSGDSKSSSASTTPSGLSAGAIAGIVIGVVVFVAIIVVVVVVVLKKKKAGAVEPQ